MNKILPQAVLLVVVACISASPLMAQVLVRVSGEVYAHQVVEVAGQVWFAMDSGAYRVDDGSLTPVLGDIAVTTIAAVNNRVWLGSASGLYRVEGDIAKPMFRSSIGEPWISAILEVKRFSGESVLNEEHVIWVGTDKGLFRVQDGKSFPTSIKESVFAIAKIENKIWVGTSRGAYRLDELGWISVFAEGDRWVSEIIDSGGDTWLITNRDLGMYGPCFKVDGDVLREVLQDYSVITLAQVHKETWFATTRGVFRNVGASSSLVAIVGIDEPVNTISAIGGEVWLGTTRGVYRINSKRVEGVVVGRDFNAKGIVAAAGDIWVWGDHGVFRLETRQVASLFRESFVFVKSVIISRSAFLVASLAILWFSLSGALRWLHPRYVNCVSVAPVLGSVVSFLVSKWPLLKSVFVRLYLGELELRMTRLKYDRGDFDRAVSEALGLLRRGRVLILKAEPRRATCCLRAIYVAALEDARDEVGGLVPLYVDMERYLPGGGAAGEVLGVEDGAIVQLADIGGVVNRKVAAALLKSGGFVFLLDRFYKVDVSHLAFVERFISRYRHGNAIVISADYFTPSLGGAEIVYLASPDQGDGELDQDLGQSDVGSQLPEVLSQRALVESAVDLPLADHDSLLELLRVAKMSGVDKIYIGSERSRLFSSSGLAGNRIVLVGDPMRTSNLRRILEFVEGDLPVFLAKEEAAKSYWLPRLARRFGDGRVVEVDLRDGKQK